MSVNGGLLWTMGYSLRTCRTGCTYNTSARALKFAAACGLVLASGVMMATLVGCKAPVYRYGETIEARYAHRTLTARLPETVRVPAAIAAMDEVLRDRGYTVLETSVTEDAGLVVARAPRFNNFPRLVIEVRQTASACVVSMRNDPFGDQDQAEQMMRALITRLGL